ncbi:MAG: hypothetical protein H0W86_02400 [Armatimonadetes bacterium]|nr:hypothetical protein [Armatimonadota bacterium]
MGPLVLIFTVTALGTGQSASDLTELDKLVTLYKSYELPLPPADAPLVALDGYGDADDGILCGYLIRRRLGTVEPTLWMATSVVPYRTPGKPVPTVAATARRIATPDSGEPAFPEEWLLAMAVIERTREHNDFAAALLAVAKRNLVYSTNRDLIPKQGASLENRMAFLALGHWMNAIIDPDIDRAYVLEQLNRLLKRNPEIASRTAWQALSDLDETVKRRYRGNDPDEVLIETLCESRVTGRDLSSTGPSKAILYGTVSAIVDRGFEIIPKLLDHVTDRRLTRAYHHGMMNAPSALCTVGDVCTALLFSMLDTNATRWPRGNREMQNELRSAWIKAEQLGEREHCLSRLSGTRSGSPSEALIRMAKENCPDIFPEAYRRLLALRPGVDTSSILIAMEQTLKPKEALVELALLGTTHLDLTRVHSALSTLKRLDQTIFDREITKALNGLPSAGFTTWNRRSMFPSFARLAAHSESEDVWRALSAVTKKAVVGLRLELINHSSYADHSPNAKRRWLVYLMEFFDDESELSKDNPAAAEEVESDHPNGHSERVQDLAVFLAAKALGIDAIPKADGSREAWARLRADVRKRIIAAQANGNDRASSQALPEIENLLVPTLATSGALNICRIFSGDNFSLEHVRNVLARSGIPIEIESDLHTFVSVEASLAEKAKAELRKNHRLTPIFQCVLLPETSSLHLQAEYRSLWPKKPSGTPPASNLDIGPESSAQIISWVRSQRKNPRWAVDRVWCRKRQYLNRSFKLCEGFDVKARLKKNRTTHIVIARLSLVDGRMQLFPVRKLIEWRSQQGSKLAPMLVAPLAM